MLVVFIVRVLVSATESSWVLGASCSVAVNCFYSLLMVILRVAPILVVKCDRCQAACLEWE